MDIINNIFVYSIERPMNIDNCFNCIRLALNTINNYGNSNDINITLDYMLRYDTLNNLCSLVDIVLFYHKNDNQLKAFTVERCTPNGLIFDTQIYLIHLNLTLLSLNNNNIFDIQNCLDLNNCYYNGYNSTSIPKQLLFTFTQQTPQLNTTQLNFEGLSMIYNDDGSYYMDNSGTIHLVCVSDNGFYKYHTG